MLLVKRHPHNRSVNNRADHGRENVWTFCSNEGDHIASATSWKTTHTDTFVFVCQSPVSSPNQPSSITQTVAHVVVSVNFAPRAPGTSSGAPAEDLSALWIEQSGPRASLSGFDCVHAFCFFPFASFFFSIKFFCVLLNLFFGFCFVFVADYTSPHMPEDWRDAVSWT